MGLFSYGGGYAMLPLMMEVLEKNNWIGYSEFLNLVALSQITPGPIAVNAATYIGYIVSGYAGGFFATFGVFTPAFILTMIVGKFSEKVKDNKYFLSFMNALRPATVAFIGSAVIIFAKDAFFTIIDKASFFGKFQTLIDISNYINPVSIGVGIISLILIKIKTPIIIVIIITGALGILLY